MQPVAPFLKWLPIASSKQNKGSPSTTTITRYARRKAPAGECKAVSRDRRDIGGMSAGYRRDVGGISAGYRRDVGGMSAGYRRDVGGMSARCRRDIGGISAGDRRGVGGYRRISAEDQR